ncbi:MAG: hypothetical protein ACJ8F3_07935 [Xanthobacteraceae bacterium]
MAVALSLAAMRPGSAQPVHTFVDPIDQQPRDCYAAPKAGGAQVLVRGRSSNTLRFWAYSTWDGSGQPMMIFNPAALAQVAPIVTRFAFYHECAHLVLRSTDELQANCEALKRMRARRELAAGDEATLKQEHYRLTGLGQQYLGTGKALWDATISCANTSNANASETRSTSPAGYSYRSAPALVTGRSRDKP